MKKELFFILLILVFNPINAKAETTIFDSNTTISSGYYDEVVVKGDGTVVNMTGGRINTLVTGDDSTFNMTGSSAVITSHVRSHDTSTLNLSSGSVNNRIYAFGHSNFNFSGSFNSSNIDFFEHSTKVTVSGNANLEYMLFGDNSSAKIHGGTIESISGFAPQNVKILISGGTINFLQGVNDDYGVPIKNIEIGILGYGLSKSVYEETSLGNVTGFWNDGTPFDIRFGTFDTYEHVVLYEGQVHTLIIQTQPTFVDTVNPSIGSHGYAGDVIISADDFAMCPSLYKFDHWEGDVYDVDSASTIVTMDTDKTVTAVFIPATPKCGDLCHPNFLLGDHNHDCIVNIEDYAMLATRWLSCTRPECD